MQVRTVWEGLLRQAYSRDVPDGSTAFWACLRRAFPDAMSNSAQRESALVNAGFVFGAGSETTANSIAMTLAVLAVDPESTRKLEQVRDSDTQLHAVCWPFLLQVPSRSIAFESCVVNPSADSTISARVACRRSASSMPASCQH